MYKPISQRDARRLRQRVYKLEKQEDDRANAWCCTWPQGTNIGNAQYAKDGYLIGAIRTARLLKHAIVASCDENGLVNFHAIPLAREKQ